MKKILLIDGNSLIFRAYFAQAYSGYIMRTSSGIPTNAIYSFANMITSLLDQGNYYDVKVAFDKGKKTFRHDKMGEYKAGRSSTPEDLIVQFPIAREFLDAANIDWFEMDNFEADDLIGSMARQAESNHDFEVEILTNDKDMFQLISTKTKIIIPEKGVSIIGSFGANELFNKWNVSPKQVPDLKGLMGDPSDNLKGVDGVGEKTAIKLITEYNSLENLYDNIENINGALKNKLINGRDSAFLCKEVATIICDIEMKNLHFNELQINTKKLIEFLMKYEMKSLINRLANRAELINKAQKKVVKQIEYEVINHLLPQHLDEKNYLFFESFASNYHHGAILGVGLSNKKGHFIINDWSDSEVFKDFLLNDTQTKITFDIKKVWSLLDNHNLKFDKKSFVFDHMVCMYVLDPNLSSIIQNIHELVEDSLYLASDDEIYGKGAKQTFEIDENIKNQFIASKAACLNQTHDKLLNMLAKFNQIPLYEQIEFPLINVLYTMEKNGILIDREELELQTINTLEKINLLEDEMRDVLKGKIEANFNFASPKQVKELIFDVLAISKSKKQSTDRDALEKLIGSHPVISLLIEHRKLSKLYTTYLRGFEKFIFPDNKIHTIFNQTLTNTGRLSSSEPNVQNISVKDETQKEVRKIFVCKNENKFLSFDYSQIELRVLAQLGQEDNLIKIFSSKRDVHDEAARLIFNLGEHEPVNSDQRRTAKVFNFGIMYGLSGFGLSQDLKISVLQANQYISDYYHAFPNFKKYKDNLISFAIENGYAITAANRKRVIHEVKSASHAIREFGKRIAVNTPIQGTAADILKVAMVEINTLIQTKKYPVKLVAQIHDEIIFEIPKNIEPKIIQELKEKMQLSFKRLYEIVENKTEIKVMLDVNESIAQNWYNLK